MSPIPPNHPAAAPLVVILDDEEERRGRMVSLLSYVRPDIPIHYFDNAPDLLQALPALLSRCILLSLDHDLGPLRERAGQRFDPGVGRAITEALATLAPSCPVIVHSSNAPAAQGMLNDLRYANWQTIRVVPYGDLDWIRAAWLPAVTMLLNAQT
jgi:hypothetical protein